MAESDILHPGDPEFEALLGAYADGELMGEDAARVEAALEAHDEARARLKALRVERRALAALFAAEAEEMAASAPSLPLDSAPDGPIAFPSRADREARAESRRSGATGRAWAWTWAGGGTVAAAAALGALAFAPVLRAPLAPWLDPVAEAVVGTEAIRPPPEPPGWRMSVAVYQRLFTTETLANADLARLADDLARVEAELGVDLSGLVPPDALTLRQVQMLAFNGRPLAQLAFLDAAGVPVSLCIFPRGDGGGEPAPEPVAGSLIGQATADWRGADHAFLLIGAAPAADLETYADALAAQLI